MRIEDLIGDLYDDGREKISLESFDKMIDKLKLSPKYSVIYDDDLSVIINEEWSSPISESVKANRIYNFDVNFIDMIKEEDQVSVLNDVLGLYVKFEKFEEASVIRDLIHLIK